MNRKSLVDSLKHLPPTRANPHERRARELHKAESDARPGRPRIQPGEITYLRTLLEKAPNVQTVERLI